MEDRRKLYLDGIRGCACVMVLVSHVVQLYIPSILSGTFDGKLLFVFPFTLLYNGNMGVYLFLLIGGFVSVRPKPYCVGQRIKKRYLRLAVPIVLSCLLVYLLANTLGSHYNSLDPITQNQGVRVDPAHTPLWKVVLYSVGEVFISRSEFQKDVLSFNHVLWTVRIEFLGSVLVYIIDSALSKTKEKGIAYLLCLLLLPVGGEQIRFAAFFLGALTANLYLDNKLTAKPLYAVLLLFPSLVFMGVPYVNVSKLYVFLYGAAGKVFPDQLLMNYMEVMHLLGGTMFLAALLSLKPLQRFFERKLFAGLGKWSFPVYLCHWTVFLYITPPILSGFLERYGYKTALLISLGITLVALALICILLDKGSKGIQKAIKV